MKTTLGLVMLALAALPSLANAQTIEGDVALSFGRAPFKSTDDADERLAQQAYKASGWVGTTFNDWRVFGDLNIYRRNLDGEDYEDLAAGGARSFGLHFGRNLGPAYVGAFWGRNQFQGDNSPDFNGYVSGKLYGFEAQYDIAATGMVPTLSALSVFAQAGRADMMGDGTDTGFAGGFGRLGVSASFDKLTVTVDYEKGRSDNVYEDEGDWGTYAAMGLAVDYQFHDRLIGTFGYEKVKLTANTEDNGYDEYYSLGIRIPLGASTGKRNNLTTSYRPGLAAAWGETLD